MSKGYLFAVLTALIWGLAPVVEKLGLSGRMDPYMGVVVRTIPIAIIGLLGLVFMGRLGELGSIDTRSALLVMAGGLLAGFVGQITYYTALKSGEASVVVPVAATYPLVALVVSLVVLGEAMSFQKLAGVLLVVGGVALLR